MRSSVTSKFVALAAAAVGISVSYGCTVADEGGGTMPGTAGTFGTSGTANTAGSPPAAAGSGAGGSGTAGATPGASGSVGTAGVGTGGVGTAGTGGVGTAGVGTGGATGGGGGTGGVGTAGAGTAGGGTGGAAVGGEITKVVKTAGCGKPFAGTSGAKVTITTMGTKAANCAATLGGQPKCGAWSVPRDYYVNMPTGYSPDKAYPLVFEGPGCGGSGKDIYPLPDIANQVIRVGVTPPPNSIGHGTNQNQGCFDDKEGDDSVDWVFYENMYDKLASEVCFDRNRVFSAGNSSGSWFSNELGCKYAGDATRPVRGVLPNTGGLPNEPQFEPTCTTKPMAGMWVHEIMDTTNPFSGNKFAIARAMVVNGCTGAQTYDTATLENYPIGGGKPDDTCKLIKNCPALYPLVVCALPGNQHGSHDDTVNPGFATFIKQFSAGAFITQ